MEIPCAASRTPIRKLILCLFLLFAAAAAGVGKPLIDSASSEGAGEESFDIICTQTERK